MVPEQWFRILEPDFLVGWWKVKESLSRWYRTRDTQGQGLPSTRSAGLGAREQRAGCGPNRPHKQRPVSWRAQGPDAGASSRARPQALESWGLGGKGTSSEPPAAQGRGGQPAALTPGVTPVRRRSRGQKDDRNHASGAAAGMGLRAGLQAQAVAPEAGWVCQSSRTGHPVGSASSPEYGAGLTSQGCHVNQSLYKLEAAAWPEREQGAAWLKGEGGGPGPFC